MTNRSGTQESRLLPATETSHFADFSPDGRLIAYTSAASGQQQVHVMALDGSGGRWQVSRNGGMGPHWRDDGREILFIAPDMTVMPAQVEPDPAFRVLGVRPLFVPGAGEAYGGLRLEDCSACGVPAWFAMSRDAQRILVKAAVAGVTAPATVVLNWTATVGR
jgi:dipeptidyl aminopeptidase/acylaminoacyl peptidase